MGIQKVPASKILGRDGFGHALVPALEPNIFNLKPLAQFHIHIYHIPQKSRKIRPVVRENSSRQILGEKKKEEKEEE